MNIFNYLENKPIFTIIVFMLLMLLSITTLDVTIMEARNFITVREMLIDDNWLLTTMNGEPRYQKPPLPSWITAISAIAFGLDNLFALRLPGFLMALTIGISIYFFSKKLALSNFQSLINALIIITSFYVLGIIIEAPWDIYTHGFMLIGIYFCFKFLCRKETQWKHVIFAGVFIGLSILCKGPVSLYALFLPFLISFGIAYKYRKAEQVWFAKILTLLIALAVGGWWYLYVRSEDPETFAAIANRETGNWSSYNVRPFYYYWSFFTQSGIWTIPAFISLLYPYLKNKVSNKRAYRFSFYWTIIAVILLSIIPEKKSRYLMPVLIPLAINTGFYIEYLIREFRSLKNKKETFPVYFNFGLIGLVGITFPFVSYFVLKDTNFSWIQFGLASLFLVVIGILILKFLFQKNIKQTFISTVLFFVFAYAFAIPLGKSLKNKDFHPIKSSNELTVYYLDYVSPELIWHYGDKLEKLDANNLPYLNKFGLLVRSESIENLKAFYTIEKVDTYDLNFANKDSKKHKSRLVNDFYVLTRKN